MIKFSDDSKHTYTYDAAGRKLRAEYHTPVAAAAEPQIPMEMLLQASVEDLQVQEQPLEMSAMEWEMPWQEFEATLEPMISVLPPMPAEEEMPIDLPTEDDLQPIIDDVPCDVTAIDYCGNFIYENGKLNRILIPGGYVTFANNNINQPEYHFYFTDHQGNVRVVANQNGEVEQVNHYYPYGGLMGESTSSDAQPYKYNGKEFDRHSGLDWFDYGARWYNGISWMTPDPHAESYYDVTPYAYCHNNPINKIDPTGKDDWEINEQGQVVNRYENKERDAFYVLDSEKKRQEGKNLFFPYGTINYTNKDSYDLYQIQKDGDARKLFEFFADNTNVEWVRFALGNEKNGLNTISTSFARGENSSVGGLKKIILEEKLNVRMMDHNHPNGSDIPSGMTGPSGDIQFIKSLNESIKSFNDRIPLYRIYLKGGRYINYNENSKPTDFGRTPDGIWNNLQIDEIKIFGTKNNIK